MTAMIVKATPLPWVLLLVFVVGCSQSRERTSGAPEAQTAEEAETSHTKPPEVKSPGTVQVSIEMQRALHLRTEPLSETTVAREIPGFGRVLDPATLAADVNELATARATAAASDAEWKRAKVLETQNTASIRAVQAAEATAVRDRLLLQTVHDRIELAWGGVLAHRADLTALSRALTSRERVIIRVELPFGESAPERVLAARVSMLTTQGATVQAEFVGSAPNTDPQLQGQGLLFLTRTNPLRLSAGAAVTAFLELEGPAVRGVFLPASSVLRHNEQTWVYVQTDPTTFVRRAVSLGAPRPGGWVITQGLAAAQRTVTQGAQMLLSEELKPQAVPD